MSCRVAKPATPYGALACLLVALAASPVWPGPGSAAASQAPPARPAGQTAPPPAPTSTLPKAKDSVKFLVIGDNLYGRENPRDYEQKFSRPYKPLLDAGVKFYASLGNHDEPSQRFYEPFNMDGKRYYTHGKGDVKFFVLDSTYMTPEQLAWLNKELEASNEKWKIPYMHHPITRREIVESSQ